MQRTSDRDSGFTIVELMVGIGIMSAITIGLLALIVSLVGVASRSIETTKQINEVQSALNTIKNDLRLTGKFLATAPGDMTRSNTEWRHNSGGPSNRTLLLQTRSTYLSNTSENRLPLYRLSVPSYGVADVCLSTRTNFVSSGIPLSGVPEYHTTIYYLHEQTLYRRIVTVPIAMGGLITECSTNTPARTCPDPSSPTKPVNCTQKDVVLAQNVTEFDILYYTTPTDQTADATALASTATQSVLNNMRTVQIKIKTSKDVGGRNNDFTSQVRATRSYGL